MATIEILTPTAMGPAESRPLTPRRSTLRGARLGIRIDHAWRSWWQASDELATLARTVLGVAEVVMFDPESRIGKPEHESAKIEAFARGVDAAIVGLGT